jgi:hypothetical protein
MYHEQKTSSYASIKLDVFNQSLMMVFYFGFHFQDIRSDAIPPAGITAVPDVFDKLLKGLTAERFKG